MINHSRILYLDGDTIVLKDISNLFSLNIHNYAIAMVKKEVKNEHIYSEYGSGVILYDRNKFLSQRISDTLWEAANEEEEFNTNDKYIFNKVLGDCIFPMNAKYNYSPEVSSEKTINNASILHYWGKEKPWNKKGQCIDIWNKYYEQLMDLLK